MKELKNNPNALKIYNYFQKKDPVKAEQFLSCFLEKHNNYKNIKRKETTKENIEKQKTKKYYNKRSYIFTGIVEHPITGEKKDYQQWAKSLNISYGTFRARILKKGNVPEIYQPKIEKKNELAYQISKEMNLPLTTVKNRLKKFGLPENWHKKNPYNKRGLITHPVTGEQKTIKQWAEYLGISYQTFRERLIKFGNISIIYNSTLKKS